MGKIDDMCVAEWLDKYEYILSNDNTVNGGMVLSVHEWLLISTDFGDVMGTSAIVDFINNRFDELHKVKQTSKQKELAEKKAKLLEELANIEKELEGV